MKKYILLIVSAFAFSAARSQTNHVQICSSRSCDVYIVLFAGLCQNPGYKILSDTIRVTPGTNKNEYLTGGTLGWHGPIFPGYGITGLRVYSDDPSSGCSTLTYQDIMAPVSGPLPGIVSTLIAPTCSAPCPPVTVFFETYCSTPTNNIFCLW
ncbi:hypothetical protein [Taibaiella chishuiensis]|uniref:Secreted protein n=1 Tax=Taibaiella chishuiensis TaxID=1434707 RepID=A0A2P8CR38_9BACT|nr:hypothetical protein [Taibaiella chishuiensis]PSK87434.1 hypothetical protein B0I18_11735 [Taibaiella chishuiensis]